MHRKNTTAHSADNATAKNGQFKIKKLKAQNLNCTKLMSMIY